jgi:glycosyltransferase involved in cell wall biosynthesis
MKVIHVIQTLSANSGGPARSVPLLCEALSKYAEIEIATIASDDAVETAELYTVNSFPSSQNYLPLGCSTNLNQYLLQADVALFNAHGLWLMATHYAVKAAIIQKKPVIITPRGMLEPAALNFSYWKKKLAGWLWQNRDLRLASCIHATSQMEADNCRRYGLKNPIAIVPNGINLSEYPLKSRVEKLLINNGIDVVEEAPRTAVNQNEQVVILNKSPEKKTLLFLSRIHAKKGLPYLLEAWALLTLHHTEWQLVIAGNDDGEHEAELKHYATKLGINWATERNDESASLYFPGPLFGSDKITAYHDADLFVLPTLSENFGMVIAEALACGTPVITTKGAPWQGLETAEAGWWIDLGTDALKKSLESAFLKTPEELHKMGLQGRKLINDNYSIESVALQMMQVYHWCVSGENPPETIQFN